MLILGHSQEPGEPHLLIVRDSLEQTNEGFVFPISTPCLIDQFHRKARLYVPSEECQRLAALHQYEMFYHEKEGDREELVSHIDRVLAFLRL